MRYAHIGGLIGGVFGLLIYGSAPTILIAVIGTFVPVLMLWFIGKYFDEHDPSPKQMHHISTIAVIGIILYMLSSLLFISVEGEACRPVSMENRLTNTCSERCEPTSWYYDVSERCDAERIRALCAGDVGGTYPSMEECIRALSDDVMR